VTLGETGDKLSPHSTEGACNFRFWRHIRDHHGLGQCADMGTYRTFYNVFIIKNIIKININKINTWYNIVLAISYICESSALPPLLRLQLIFPVVGPWNTMKVAESFTRITSTRQPPGIHLHLPTWGSQLHLHRQPHKTSHLLHRHHRPMTSRLLLLHHRQSC